MAFVVGAPLPGARRSARAPRVAMADSKQSARSAWPAARFVKNLMFFRPVFRGERQPDGQVPANPSERPPVVAPVVFVAGATGGTGKRVVKQLQDQGFPVRCLVRNVDRATKILTEAGVNLEAGQGSSVELVAGDLYNIHPDLVKRVGAIITATGVKVGPADDDAERSKYYQGIKFYEPEILEDTPENVEYKGIKNLVETFKEQLNSAAPNELPVISFSSAQSIQKIWGVVDDIVMGGVSQSQISLVEPGVAKFAGQVSEDNSGGFASVRTAAFDSPVNASGFEGFRLRLRGDGQRYKFIARCDEKWDGNSFCYSVDTTDTGEWQEVDIPFSSLRPVFRAKTLTDGTKFDPRTISAFQIMLSKFEYDGELNPNFKAGQFSLEIGPVSVVRSLGSSSAILGPRMIHVGSAGVTRVLRTDEFPDLETQPPAVRMNAMLGRILEWKFAGEDAIRQNINSYAIVRPCALTEEDPVGFENLKFDSGDNMTGSVSRDDVASVIVEILKNPAVSKTTIEVAKKVEADDNAQGAPLIADLEEADLETRGYAGFPFTPQ